MNYEKLENLSQLLGCYFHQDWLDEFDSDQAVLLAIIENEPKERLQCGVLEIEMLLRMHLPERDLRSVMINTVGCYFEPDSQEISYEKWLMCIREKLIRYC